MNTESSEGSKGPVRGACQRLCPAINESSTPFPLPLLPPALADLLRAALLHFAESPSWAYGINGFFLWTASKACQIPVKGASRSDGPTTGFWLGELENAIWVAAVSRTIVLMHGNKTPIPVLTRQALREGFYTLFNLTKDTRHFAESCVCEDKVFAYEDTSYHKDIYAENVLPIGWAVPTVPAVADKKPIKASDKTRRSAKATVEKISDDEMELRKASIKRIEINHIETCDRLVWPEMDREAEADTLRRDRQQARSKGAATPAPTKPVDHSFSPSGIASLYVGKQRPFSSRIIAAHWVMATPLLEKAEKDATAFSAKLRRGCHIMAFDPVASQAAASVPAPVKAAKAESKNSFALLGDE
ncbi:hypothetical protein B0T18DRAFT_394443 [Schizothecium vesticola]|uniref:Uncharacterized protein n=1 Tax=Schizothecium vesticola TaxID=314040 RepID=A0AA40BPL1_9PEZI|nr:hypothetical protein B0T18DRAFT_394443 [Schizothecium vesticola]